MAQVAPPSKLALQSIKVNENLSKYPQTHYGIPKSDNDFAVARDSLRERSRGITSNSYVTENQKIVLNIPPQQRNLVPDETIIRLEMKTNAWKPNWKIGGSIQRAIKTLTIRDGRGTVLEQINDYNKIAEILIQTHVPDRVQNTLMQTEGIYDSYKLYAGGDPTHGYVGGISVKVGSDNVLEDVLTDFNNQNNFQPFTSEMQKGDMITVIDIQGNTSDIVEVKEVKHDTVEIHSSDATVNSDNKTNIRLLHTPRKEFSDYYRHIGQPLLDSKAVVFTFNPLASGILSSSKHIPLWVTKGLQIEITLDSNATIFHAAHIDTDKPEIQIHQADVLYTAVTLTPVMQSALESQYHRRGLNLLVPVFHIDRRKITSGNQTIQEDYYNSFAMLNRVYQACQKHSDVDASDKDSFRFRPLKPTRRFLEYNRIYMPHWGNDNDLSAIDHFNESRKGINLLGDRNKELITFGQFTSDGPQDTYRGTSEATRGGISKCKEIFVNNLETEPSGFLTGVDTNNGTIRLRIETANTTYDKDLQVLFMAFKMITFQDGAPPLVQE